MRAFSALKGHGLKGKSIRGSLLTVLNFGAQNVIRLGGNLILTRILFPEAFGLMALVQVVMAGLNMFSDLGLRMSIIQSERGDDPRYLNTAWVMQIVRGAFLWLLTLILASPVAAFYEAPILAQLLPVVGLTAILQGFNSTKIATAGRHLALGRLTAIEIASRFLGLVVLVVLALWLETVWALVLGGLIAPLLIACLSHIALPGPANRFQLDSASARQLFDFGKYIFLSTIAGFLISQADRAILGKFISLSDLALYSIAFFLATLPKMVMTKLSDSILFPLYSHALRDETENRWNKLAKARFLVVGTSVALSAGLAICGDWLIVLLYDTRYEAAGPLLILIAIASMPSLIAGGYGMVILARGHSRLYAFQLVVSATLRTSLLVVLIAQYGVLGAIIAPFLSGLLIYPLIVWLVWPYGAWLPWQDLTLTLAGALAILAAALTNQEVLQIFWLQIIQ